ncbi:hypothetical protein [Sphingomonas hankyongi]|uniref:Phasin domain-containing protein n=1 Tax=Sphingomonas hankyongi TaxID=2908209 RepID=A0ABT0S2B1_9SPHN|nr:hypothetical protein [Sphingomonas hankyongi]MCL6729784.1 hypothetical protein [Sphingomonas hankyongi]
MFGRKRSGDDGLRANHQEFYRNCLIQIADLESRTADWSGLKGEFAAVWSESEDAASNEITQKVALARRFAIDVESSLATASIETAAKGLNLLQEIVDNAEHQLQGLLVGLVTAQSLRSAGP